MNTNIIEELSLASHTEAVNRHQLYSYQYQPLEAGSIAPAFSIQRQQGILSDEFSHSLRNENIFSLQDFLDYGQPLVIFFSGASSRTVLQVNKLEKLQQRIHEQGGKLLVVTPASSKYIKRQLTGTSELSVFHDCDNEIAESFGLYNEQNPLWQWVSGIDEEEETLSGFYVVSPDKTIAYSFTDFEFALYRSYNFSSLHFIEHMLDAVRRLSVSIHGAEVYRLVS